MKNVVDFEKVVLWLVLLVRVGILAAIVWYGVSEFRRWKRKASQKQHDTSGSDSD